MQFNSIQFMIFFPIAIAIYFVIPKKMRSVWLLVASYYFYMGWNAKYALLIAFSTVVTFASGLAMEKRVVASSKKGILAFTIISNLLILGIFKYADFLIVNLNSVYKTVFADNGGGGVKFNKLNLLLPVGISFYTFQALGYIIDVYRGDIKAEHNFITYALFVSFFPQLVAGPIERSKNLLGQMRNIEQIKLWNLQRFSSGCILMIWGFFLKMVIADRIGIIADNTFNNFLQYGAVELIAGAVSFAIQIYCDFGSYSMIAIGAAKIMGFELMENFNTPYFAVNIQDFWSRWHISLSTWFRDYVYIPLGGNRRGKTRTRVNKMIVFVLSGIWHGSGWRYIAWGIIHGAYQVIADISKPLHQKLQNKMQIKTECFSWKFLKVAITFVLVDIAWIFFRSQSLRKAVIYIIRILKYPNPWLLFNGGIYTLGLDRVEMNILMFSLLLLFAVEIIRYKRKMTLDKFLLEQNLWFSWSVSIALIVIIFIFGKYGPDFNPKQFIYFQF